MSSENGRLPEDDPLWPYFKRYVELPTFATEVEQHSSVERWWNIFKAGASARQAIINSHFTKIVTPEKGPQQHGA